MSKPTWPILLGTHNKGKIAEFQALFEGTPVKLINEEAPDFEPAEEVGESFIENAILKARHVCEQTGLPSLADDSGLMVMALDGAPGLFSARYAGQGSTSQEKCQHLLKELAAKTTTSPNKSLDRSAKFICVLALVRTPDDPDPIVVRAEWLCEILQEMRGTGGFGYDPIAYLPDRRCSVAELSSEEKSRISHRGQAVQTLLRALPKHWPLD